MDTWQFELWSSALFLLAFSYSEYGELGVLPFGCKGIHLQESCDINLAFDKSFQCPFFFGLHLILLDQFVSQKNSGNQLAITCYDMIVYNLWLKNDCNTILCKIQWIFSHYQFRRNFHFIKISLIQLHHIKGIHHNFLITQFFLEEL